MKKERPKNMDLTTIKLPVMGVASILHRISAVVIWVSLAFFLTILSISLNTEEGFNSIQNLLSNNFIAQFFTWGFLTAFGYYTMGGAKHLLQEFGYFESLVGGKMISQVAIGLGIVLSILFAIWIWS
ncbi:MAG: succinate dehydrogenase, cytochrome b556 subunit [Pseudomonadota bacterium]